MIFQTDAIALIRERRKTQTRRDWPVCRVTAGRTYRVQPGRGQPGVLEITVMDTRQERLGDISQRDVRAEGFRFRQEFETRWAELHGRWTPDLPVWVVTFTVGDQRDRFDRPRLLKATPGHAGDTVDPHQDYTSRPDLAMFGEPEAVDGKTLQRFAAEGVAGHARRKAAQQARKPLTERVADIQRRALDGDQQAKRHLHVICQRVQDAERKQARDTEEAA